MKRQKRISRTFLFFIILVNISCINDKSFENNENYNMFDSSWKSLEQYRCPEWFRDSKFGIFICWNPHAVAAHDDWYARNMYIEGHNSYKYHLENYGHPSEVGYKDIIGMWKEASLKHGLRFGVTTHLARSWSWMQTSHSADTSGPYKGIPYDGRNPEYQDLYFETHGNTTKSYPQNPPDYWPKQWYSRIKDLVDQHQPDLLYFDGGIPFGETGRKMLAYFYNSNIKTHKGELQAVMNIKNNTARPVGNDRFMTWHGDYREGVAVQDIERSQRSKIGQSPWQTDDSIGPWFWTKDSEYRSPEYIIHQLIDIVSKNGNLLLNVPLRRDGSLDEEADDLLHELGKWMGINGEGIYASRPFIHFNGLPARFPNDDFTNIDKSSAENLRFTTRGDTIYVFTGGLPENNVLIKPLNKAVYKEFSSVEMLGVEQLLEFNQDNEALKIKMPDAYPCNYSICLKIF